jgi:LytS/YehU family sensor histidine kinase
LNFYQLARQKAAEAEQLQKEYAQVRLQALKSQVNPHFLFNSLSVLSSLVHVSPETSEQFIIHLSKAYRYILDQKESGLVTLKEELSFLEAYFFLLQIRFDQKIKLQLHIKPGQEQYELPPLTLQLLVENAVKHNKMSVAEPLVISISTEGEWLIARNNISHRDQPETSTGVGLENIQKRYVLLTERKVMVENTGQYFRVKLPLLKHKS